MIYFNLFLLFLFPFNLFAIRGETTPLNEIPEQMKTSVVQILKSRGDIKNKHVCTGTILKSNLILTAAHCFTDLAQSYILVGFGQTANIFGMGDGEGVLRASMATRPYSGTSERLRFEDSITGACQGDSGSPLFTKINGDWFQVGITSQGDCHILSMFEKISWEKLKIDFY